MNSLGYMPEPGRRASLSQRLFGSRRFSRAIEFRIMIGWLGHEGRALDLGAGNGEFSAQLSLRGYRVVAFDLDATALRSGREQHRCAIEWVAGDATRLPFADGAFDCVLCNSAIEHFSDDQATLREVARVIKAGGQLVVTTDSLPSHPSRWLRLIPASWRREGLQSNVDLAKAIADSHQKRHHVVHFYDAERLNTLLREHGFRVEAWRYYMNGVFSQGIFEMHLLLNALDFYNRLSRRLYPLFAPFTFPVRPRRPGYGLAVHARRSA